MKRLKRIAALTVIVGMLGVSMPLSTLAATVKTISSVTIYVGMEEIEAGETLPGEGDFGTTSTGNYVYTNSDKYEVNDLEWVTSDTKEIKI